MQLCVSECVVQSFFFHLGECGVRVVRCLSLIFTLLLFSSEPADVVGTFPVCAFTTSCHGTAINCCVVLCVRVRNESSLGFFSVFFSCEYSAGNFLTILAIAASRKQPDIAHWTTHLSTARGTRAIPSPQISVCC